MRITRRLDATEPGFSRYRTGGALVLAVLLGVAFAAEPASARSWGRSNKRGRAHYCTDTANLQYLACKSEIKDDFSIAQAICVNVSDEEERGECNAEAREEQNEGRNTCAEQRTARHDLCDLLGEERYEPDMDPALFDEDFDALTNPNPYFPLAIGNVWEFESGDEAIRIEVMDKTKLIDGVTCIVVNDLVSEDGVPIEDTDDWFAQRKDGTVDYCGEIARDFEVFDGDDPEEPELVEIEGSFKAGRDGDKSGTLFPGTPVVGDAFRQEWSASNAEDAAIVLSTTYLYPSDTELDELLPADLAELFCGVTPCVVIGEFSPIEPGVFERKYYAQDFGKILEVDVEEGAVTQLVGCNFDPRCGAL